jgi:DNA-binding MarR family transcriptional regulator
LGALVSNYLKAISNKDFVCESDIKYFLIRILQVFDLGGNINISFAKLKDELGVTARVVHKGLESLCENEVLIRQRNTSMQKRQVNCYVFGGRFRDAMLRTDEVKCQHKLKIDELLSPDKSSHKAVNDSGNKVQSGKLEYKNHPLGLSSRLLLIVMLYHANSEGVVRSLGVAELAVLAGQSAVAVKENIKKLKAKGYIRCSVGGLSKNLIFNKPYSHYFLNLTSINSGDGVRSVVIASSSSRKVEAFKIVNYASNLNKIGFIERAPNLFKLTCNRRRWGDTELQKVLPFFKAGRRQRFTEYLQLKLEVYAAAFLSDNWMDLGESFINTDIQELIEIDIVQHHEEGGIGTLTLLCEFIYAVSLELAIFIRGMMLTVVSCESIDFSVMRYVIVPQVQYLGEIRNFVVESFYSAKHIKKELPAAYIFKASGLLSKLTKNTELPKEESLKFNLMSV